MFSLIGDLLVKWPVMLGLLVVFVSGSVATGTGAAKGFVTVSIAVLKVVVGVLVGMIGAVT